MTAFAFFASFVAVASSAFGRARDRRRSLVVAVASALVVMLGASGSARAEPLRIVVAVGHREGLAHEVALKHAERDAARVRDVFVDHGGVAPASAFLLQAPTVAALYATIDRAAALARTHAARDVTLVFYFSGHGDHAQVHLGREALPLADLDEKLKTFPAGLKLVVVDACRISEGRAKGVTKEEPFPIHLDASEGASGTVRLQASSDGDVAQESDELGGAIFTHYWVVGLLGAADTDGDGRITLAESYAHAQAQTLLRTARSAGVLQRPEATFDMREAAPVVLTRLGTSSAIGLPRGADTYYLVYGLGSRSVLAEVWAAPDRATFAAVPRGSYLVHQRAPGRSGAVQIALGDGERRELTSSEFAAVPEERLARKGGALDLTPNEVELSYGLGASPLVDVGHAIDVGYARAWDELALSASVGGGFGRHDGPSQTADVTSVHARALAEWRVGWPRFGLRFGVGPALSFISQTIVQGDSARLEAAGYTSERRSTGWLFGGAAFIGARAKVMGALFAELGALGTLQGAKIADKATAVAAASGTGGVGVEF